jgi:hypothetical protein
VNALLPRPVTVSGSGSANSSLPCVIRRMTVPAIDLDHRRRRVFSKTRLGDRSWCDGSARNTPRGVGFGRCCRLDHLGPRRCADDISLDRRTRRSAESCVRCQSCHHCRRPWSRIRRRPGARSALDPLSANRYSHVTRRRERGRDRCASAVRASRSARPGRRRVSGSLRPHAVRRIPGVGCHRTDQERTHVDAGEAADNPSTGSRKDQLRIMVDPEPRCAVDQRLRVSVAA